MGTKYQDIIHTSYQTLELIKAENEIIWIIRIYYRLPTYVKNAFIEYIQNPSYPIVETNSC